MRAAVLASGGCAAPTAMWLRFAAGANFDLDALADDEFVVANREAGGWDVYRDLTARRRAEAVGGQGEGSSAASAGRRDGGTS